MCLWTYASTAFSLAYNDGEKKVSYSFCQIPFVFIFFYLIKAKGFMVKNSNNLKNIPCLQVIKRKKVIWGKRVELFCVVLLSSN